MQAEIGVDAGAYARQLMGHAKELADKWTAPGARQAVVVLQVCVLELGVLRCSSRVSTTAAAVAPAAFGECGLLGWHLT